MAAVLQTGSFINGEWRSQTVDINTVLQRNESKNPPKLPESGPAPVHGILTQTVVESPVIHWILPINIRGVDSRDVAFIGDNVVQIRCLGAKGQFHDVARKDFGSRIRNARLIGSTELGTEPADYSPQSSSSQGYDEDVIMDDVFAPKSLEYIVLAIEDGDIVFLFAQVLDGDVELVKVRHTVARPMLSEQPGKHIAVDPSSQYMAVAGAENVFAIYTLLAYQGKPLRPILSERYLHVEGVIHKMEFLFPKANDPNHIILLLMVVNRGNTRMFVYDWVAGQELRDVRTHFKNGSIVGPEHRMPLLLIPMRIRSAFLLVSDTIMAVCEGILYGTPTFTNIDIKSVKTSPRHLGRDTDTPLWTSWFRPPRTYQYSQAHDDLYIAREDGAILFLENNTEDFVQAQMDMDVDCNIGSAFASLDKRDEYRGFGDCLLVGGDSCNGGLYLVEARISPALLTPLPNWSPTIDFVLTTAQDTAQETLSNKFSNMGLQDVSKPEKIFALTGRGKKTGGALSEMRYGHEAYIRVETELDVPIAGSWYLPPSWQLPDSEDEYHPFSSLILLCLANRSSLLHLAADDSSIEEVDQGQTWLDLSSPTLIAVACKGITVQITERSVNISTKPALLQSTISDSTSDVYQKQYLENCPVLAAYVHENELALTVHRNEHGVLQLRAFHINISSDVPGKKSLLVYMSTSLPLSTYPNIVSIEKVRDSKSYHLIWSPRYRQLPITESCIGVDLLSLVNIFTVTTEKNAVFIDATQEMKRSGGPSLEFPDTCTTLVSLQGVTAHSEQSALLLAGHQDGLLVMIHCRRDARGCLRICKRPSRYVIGSTPVIVQKDSWARNVALICCDSKVWRLCYNNLSYADPPLRHVWFTNTENSYAEQPTVDRIRSLPQGLLAIAGCTVLVARLDDRSRAVPRPISLPGTPFRLLYDKAFNVLVIAVEFESRPVLGFLNPETGAEIKLCRQDGQISHNSYSLPLHNSEAIVLGLLMIPDTLHPETSILIVILKARYDSRGSICLFRAKWGSLGEPGVSLPQDVISLAAMGEKSFKRPVYAATTLYRTVIFCVGDELHQMNITQGQLMDEHMPLPDSEKIYKLPSPAVSMSIVGSTWLYVHTARHSLLKLEIEMDSEDDDIELIAQFADELDRDGLNHIIMTKDDGSRSCEIAMISDKACSVTGLYSGDKKGSIIKDYQTLFEAEMPASVLRFRVGNTRPPWDVTWKSKAKEWDTDSPISLTGMELLGLSIDGSIRHFTILNECMWRLLCLIQDHARRQVSASSTPPYRPIHWRNKPDPRMKHIDGDFLRRFLRYDKLERLLQGDDFHSSSDDEDSDETDRKHETREVMEEFCRLVQEASGSDILRLVQSGRNLEESSEQPYLPEGLNRKPWLRVIEHTTVIKRVTNDIVANI